MGKITVRNIILRITVVETDMNEVETSKKGHRKRKRKHNRKPRMKQARWDKRKRVCEQGQRKEKRKHKNKPGGSR